MFDGVNGCLAVDVPIPLLVIVKTEKVIDLNDAEPRLCGVTLQHRRLYADGVDDVGPERGQVLHSVHPDTGLPSIHVELAPYLAVEMENVFSHLSGKLYHPVNGSRLDQDVPVYRQ